MRIELVLATGAAFFLTIISATGCGRNNRMKAAEAFEDAKVIALVTAAQQGDVAGVRTALQAGANANAHGKDDATPLLMVLATTVNKAGLSALLAGGADPNLPATRGIAPMVLVARAKDTELLRIFLKGGGDPNLKASSGEPLLWLAARDERWENVEALLQAGADINAVDGPGYTTLMNLTTLRRYDRVAWLIERGADVRYTNGIGVSLPKLIATDRITEKSPQFAWRQRVIALLETKGIRVAVPPAHN